MKKIILSIAGGITLIILTFWILFLINKNSIRSKIEKEMDNQVNAIVAFDDFGVSILRDFPNVTITLNNLLVTGKGEFANDTLAAANEIDLELKTLKLIVREVELKSIHLNTPFISLQVLKNGHNNFSIIPTDTTKAAIQPAAPTALHIALDQVSISNGDIEYHDQTNDVIAHLKKMTYSGKGDFNQDIFDLKTVTDIKEFTLDYGTTRLFAKKEVEIDLNMGVDLNKNFFVLKENFLRVNHFRFGVQGDFSILNNGYDFNLRFSTEATDFKNIISLLPGMFMKDMEDISTEGKLAFNGFIDGNYLPETKEYPSFLANIKVSDAIFKIDTLPNAIKNIQMEMAISNLASTLDSTTIDIKHFQCQMEKHSIKGRLKVKGVNNLAIDTDIIADLDLGEIERMYPLKGIDLKGLADFNLKALGNIVYNNGNLKELPVFTLNANLSNGRVKYEKLPAAIDNISLQFSASNASGDPENTIIDFKKFHLDLDKNKIRGFIAIEGYNILNVNTDIKVDIDLADIEKLYPIDTISMKGKLNIDLKSNGIYDKSRKIFPKVDASITLINGELKAKQYPEPIKAIHFNGEVLNKTGQFADTRIIIKQLTYNLEDEPFVVSGSISNLNNFDYNLKVKGLVDLEKLTKIYPIEGMKLKGIIDSDITTSGRLTDIENNKFENVQATGTIEVKDFSIAANFIPHPISISDGLFTITPSKIALDKLIGKFGKSNVSIKGDMFNYLAIATQKKDVIKWDLDFKCDTLDLNEWMPPTAVADSSKSVTQSIIFQIPVNMDAVFDSEIEHLLFQDFKISKMNGEITFRDGIMKFKEAGFNSLNADFKLSGSYDPREVEHPLFDFQINVAELDINKAYKEVKLVRDLLPAAGDAEGIFSVTYKMKGELQQDFYPKMDKLKGGGEMKIANAKINGMKIFDEISKAAKKDEVKDPHLKDFTMVTEIRDSKVFVKPFSMRIAGFDTDVEGVGEMSGAIRYLVKIELPPFGMKIPFHVTGTYDQPKVRIGKGHVIQASDSLQTK